MHYFISFLVLCSLSTVSFSQKSQVLYDHALVHYNNMEYEEGLKDINAAIDKSKKFYNAYLLRAKIYYDMGEDQKALDQLASIMEEFPTADHAYYERGIIFYDDENYQKAILDFDKAVELYSGDTEYFYYQGIVAQKLNDMPKACTAWNAGFTKLGSEDCKKLFDTHCEGVELIVPEAPEFNNPFEKLKRN